MAITSNYYTNTILNATTTGWNNSNTSTYSSYVNMLESLHDYTRALRVPVFPVTLENIPWKEIAGFSIRSYSQRFFVTLSMAPSKDGYVWIENAYKEVPFREGLERYFDPAVAPKDFYEIVRSYHLRTPVFNTHLRTLFHDAKLPDADVLAIGNYANVKWEDNRAIVHLIDTNKLGKLGFPPGYNIGMTKLHKSMTYGAFLKAIYPKKTDAEIEELVNAAKKHFVGGDIVLGLAKGEDIRKFYHYTSYHQREGLLGDLANSCMRYTNTQKFLNIYCENACCEMIVALLDNKLIGRALLWTARDGRKYCDRIYGSRPTQLLIQNYVEENKWIMARSHKGHMAVIQLDKSEFRYYPYIDTYNIVDVTKKRLYSYGNPEGRGRIARNTNGALGG